MLSNNIINAFCNDGNSRLQLLCVELFYHHQSTFASKSLLYKKLQKNFIIMIALFIIFVGIIAELPGALGQFFASGRSGALSAVAIISLIFVVIGVIFGTIFAVSLKTSSLVLLFSIMTMIFAIYFLIEKEKINPKPRNINLIYRVILGFLSGFLSAPMGIGGGVYNTPIFKIIGYPINVAIGSSAAIGFLISLIGAFGYASSGSYLNVSAPLSLGFLNIPAFLIFVPITTFMAKIGAESMHKFNKRLVNKLFGVYLFIVSCRLFYEYLSF